VSVLQVTQCGFARFSIAILAVFVTGCATQDANTYRADETGQTLAARPAVVLSVRDVTIEDDKDLSSNWYGPAVGAAGGAIGVNAAGGGDLLAIGAAIIGLGLGYLAEEAFDSRAGYEYLLQDVNDPSHTYVVVQEARDVEAAKIGSRVTVVSGSGYTRVIPIWTPSSSDPIAPGSGAGAFGQGEEDAPSSLEDGSDAPLGEPNDPQ